MESYIPSKSIFKKDPVLFVSISCWMGKVLVFVKKISVRQNFELYSQVKSLNIEVNIKYGEYENNCLQD